MAKKTKKSFPGDETVREPEIATDIPYTDIPATPAQEPAPKPVQPSKPRPAVQAVKKRVRVRKKATKHLSVAVLCANPQTRRFI